MKVLILKDKFCEEQAFPSLLPTGKFGYNANAPQDFFVIPAW